MKKLTFTLASAAALLAAVIHGQGGVVKAP